MKNQKQPNYYAVLSGIGVQLAATIFLGAYTGQYLDQKYQNEKSWFTLGLVLLSVAIALYNALRQINRLNNKS